MKMRGLRNLFAASAIVTASFPAIAGVSTFTPLGTINHYEDYGSSLQISTTGTFTNPAGCSVTAGSLYYPKTSLTDAEKQQLYRVVLSAFLAGRQLQLKIDGNACSGAGTAGAPVYYAVMVAP